MTPLLAVHRLSLSAQTRHGAVPLVDDVSFEVPAGGALGIVGESGSGKSLTLRAILGLLPPRITVDGGTIRFGGAELDERELRRVRGRRIAAVFQEPAAALDPLMRVGEQIGEALFGAFRRNRRAAHRRAVELLTLVGMADPEVVARLYPHELSGGMQQRACIAAALCRSPELVLLDEPTTALDVTIQDQVLDLVARLRQELGLAIVLVTHDLGVVAETCDEVTVMYAGRVVEQGSVREVFGRPAHPYTSGLIHASPQVDRPGDALEPIPGAPPQFGQLPSGCRFHPRCALAVTACHAGEFPLLAISGDRTTACIRHNVLTGSRTND